MSAEGLLGYVLSFLIPDTKEFFMRFSVLLVALLFAGVMTVGCKSSSNTGGDGVAAVASKCANCKAGTKCAACKVKASKCADCKAGKKCAKCKAKANKCADCKAGQKCAKCQAKGAGNKAKAQANKAADAAKDAAKDATDAVKAEMPK